MKNDDKLIGRSLEDVIIEPVRSILIPGFNEIKLRCRDAGALGGGIAGSGPSIFMLSTEETTAKSIEVIMKEIYEKIGVDFKTYVTGINPEGVKIVE
jgi:homoserine kinase